MGTREFVHRLQPAVQAIVERSQTTLVKGRSLVAPARGLWQTVTPLGRSLALIGVLAWIGGWALGWNELMVLAGACLILLLAAGLFVLGRAGVQVDVQLDPLRVVAGDPSAGQVLVTNRTSRRRPPMQIELPVGGGVASFDVPSLAPGGVIDHLFVIPTERRGVIPVGPATSVRSDPIGLLHREAPGSAAHELIVHPPTVALEPFGSGLFRDLEGVTTKDLSVSDLAFHALRDYVPGDDWRHIHWRSSAKTSRLLVRQFLDTRRSTLCVLVDGQSESYGDPEEFETGLQVAGSVVRRACRDERSAVLVVGSHVASGTALHPLLDVLARAELDSKGDRLGTLVQRATARSGDMSFAVLVSGSQCPPEQLQRAAAQFRPEIGVVGIRVLPSEQPSINTAGRANLLQLRRLSDLPAMLQVEVVV